MKYIWVNPVVMEMYKKQNIELEAHLDELGFTPLKGDLSILNKVREQFVSAVNEARGTVLDTRCPLAVKKIKEKGLDQGYYVPEIHPILIRTSFSLYEKVIKDHEEHELHIMCPCQSLSELGNRLAAQSKSERITFYAWNKWQEMHDIPKAKKIEYTPIPLGFFSETGLKVKELSGEEEIITNLADDKNEGLHLFEMLYCKGGCHNGDGV